MAILNGLNSETSKNLQLDAGVLLHSVTEEEILNIGASPETLQELITQHTLGATKGGATFSAIPEMRSLLDGVNGSRGNYQDGQVIDSWDISLKATISELTMENIKRSLAMGGSASEDRNYHKQTASVGRVAKDAFLSSVAWVGTMNGKKTPMVILIKGALNTNGMTFTAEDKNTGSIELELKAHFSLSKPEDVPFVIFTPGTSAQ